MHYASGENFTIDLEEGVAVCRMFKQAELDHVGLERCSVQLLHHARALTVKGEITGMVIDLRRVPGVVSPEVARNYASIASSWEDTGQRIAFLVIDDAVQMMQLGRILSENAPRYGALVTDRNDARRFAGATDLHGPSTGSVLMERPSRLKRF